MQPPPSSAAVGVPPGTALVYVPVQIGSNSYDCYQHKQSIRLGITQIIVGILCIVFNSVSLGVSIREVMGFIGHGYWCGILFIITGVFGVTAGKRRNGCQIITFMVLCIISAVFTIVLFILGILGAIVASSYGCHSGYGYYNRSFCYTMLYNVPIAMASCLAILGVFEAIVAIWGAVLCCRSGVCCCTGPTVALPAVGYYPNTGHMIYMTQVQGGQQVYTPQPPQPPQGQIPPSVYVQPGCAMPSTNISPVFHHAPPPYTTYPSQPLWMIPPATTNPNLLAAQAPPTDTVPNQTKEML